MKIGDILIETIGPAKEDFKILRVIKIYEQKIGPSDYYRIKVDRFTVSRCIWKHSGMLTLANSSDNEYELGPGWHIQVIGGLEELEKLLDEETSLNGVSAKSLALYGACMYYGQNRNTDGDNKNREEDSGYQL